jgi:mannosyltransferase OCH1-like enzyme
MIPKVVYQTWYDKSKIPKEYQEILSSNIQMNPNYQFILMDDKDLYEFFNRSHIPKHWQQCYHMINPHYGPARADLFRYTIIYLYGGIYLDIKIKCLVPFDQWIYPHDTLLLSYWNNLYYQKNFLQNEKGELQNWHIIAQSQHPFHKILLDELCHKILHIPIEKKPFITGKFSVLQFTGPLLYTQIIEPYFKTSQQYRIINSSLVLDYGSNFQGIHDDNYKHYTKLNEPLFLHLKTMLSPFIHKIHSLQELKLHKHTICIFKSYKILSALHSMIQNCHFVFAIKNQIPILMAYSQWHSDYLSIIFNHTLINEEKVFYYQNQCIKQLYVNDNNTLFFHHKSYIQILEN